MQEKLENLKLSQLIRAVMDDNGFSYADLGKRARDPQIGGSPYADRSLFHKYVTKGLRQLPGKASLDMIARVLGVDEDVVLWAALRELGWRIVTLFNVNGVQVIVSNHDLTTDQVDQVGIAGRAAIDAVNREEGTTWSTSRWYGRRSASAPRGSTCARLSCVSTSWWTGTVIPVTSIA